MGGGFGGFIINLIHSNAIEEFVNKTIASYFFAIWHLQALIMIEIENGTKSVDFRND
jgi:galactokinase